MSDTQTNQSPNPSPSPNQSLRKGAPDIRALTERLATQSAMLNRYELLNRVSPEYGAKRDLYHVFNYKKSLTIDDFYKKYVRQDVAKRIIELPSEATWSDGCSLIETSDELTQAWDQFARKHNLWAILEKADRLARIFRFSVLIVGFEGGLARPRPQTANEILYLRPVDERIVRGIDLHTDISQSNYGKPSQYKLRIRPQNDSVDVQGVLPKQVGSPQATQFQEVDVNATRTIHITENAMDDEVFGTPALASVYNVLDDLLKVSGGTAETYWLTSNRGLQADIDKDMDIDPTDAAMLGDAIDEYQEQLRRVLRTRGVTITSLGSDTPQPNHVFNMLFSMLAGATGIPKTLLMGLEVGELASAQDRSNWSEVISRRRRLHAEPVILRPLITLLMESGILPQEEDYTVDWPSAFKMSPLEESQAKASQARAVQNLSVQTKPMQMQVTSREEARAMVGLTGDLDESEILEAEVPDQGVGDDGRGGPGQETPQDDNVRQRAREDNDDTRAPGNQN